MATIGIDIDGTVADFNTIANYYATVFDPELVNIKYETYDLAERYGWPKEKADEFFNLYALTIFSSSRPFFAASFFINQLGLKHNIKFITARNKKYEGITKLWLKNWNFNYDTLIMDEHEKHKYDLDIIVEDNFETLKKADQVGMQTLCYHQPYNAHYRGLRAYSWPDAFNCIIGKFKKGVLV